MKQTVIKYQNLVDGQIKIVAIENAATMDEIEKEFGLEVSRVYQTGDRYRLFDEDCLISAETELIQIRAGAIIGKPHFSRIITEMKKAAARLIEIRQKVAEYEVKEIII